MGLCKKKKNVGREEIGTKWIWTALDTTTRLILCHLVGDRTLKDARLFLKDLISRTQQLPLFTSDELPHYADGLKELFHKLVKPKPTGRRGRPRKPEKVVDESLDYATVHKTRENGRVVKVETKVVFGLAERIEGRLEQLPSKTINTSYVERSNLNWRMWDAHLTRKSLMYAKSIRWLRAKFSICVAFYNFIRPHETLSRRNDRRFLPKTPAMAAGVTDHQWTVRELLICKA
ncbi:MAG: DDE-type integrase/transposase/recombinase [Proteobacteria bacterium]|nr:DDE-type integrase/transposase/recombinase [Pseudomonadota bacterium]